MSSKDKKMSWIEGFISGKIVSTTINVWILFYANWNYFTCEIVFWLVVLQTNKKEEKWQS
ncbi:hypothetical protein [Cyclobacterium lianum]|uniref:hypothetical protein n=1 Tax=Cyclobacterium lianum TaxID=388280 RepID=UPI00116047E2|nr:hypothetical protein [Cyclobacterium lianum]